MMLMDLNDTIAAPATPEGLGALAIIRLSGPQALTIADNVFRPAKLSKQQSHTVQVGWIYHNGQPVDEAVATVFRAPRSYTREDMVEFSIHGSPFLARRVLEALLQQGARLARPGEFTLRAFVNGRMDLAQAEAVADLIAADTDAAHRYALYQMRGGYSAQLTELHQRLVQLAALLELELDFSEEHVEFAPRSELLEQTAAALLQVRRLVQSFQWGNVVRHGVTTTIAGRPNAGKSTLLNALLQEERAIVSDIPGTTRDTLEEVIVISGIRFRLIDTAGLRDATDCIEQMGVGRALEKIRTSSLVLYVFDVTALNAEDVQNDLRQLPLDKAHVILVGNKIDLADAASASATFGQLGPVLFVSARNGRDLEQLRTAMVEAVSSGQSAGEMMVVTNVRHVAALQRAADALAQVQEGIQQKRSGELIAADLRRALHALGEVIGKVSSEDLLDFIFSRFCIGK